MPNPDGFLESLERFATTLTGGYGVGDVRHFRSPLRRERVWIVTSIQPELWVERAGSAVVFYTEAFGASVLHLVGDGEDVVAQLSIGDAAFWVTSAASEMGRFSPRVIGGATSRTLLVVDDPDSMVRRSVAAGAVEKSPIGEEHGWRVGRVVDPFGHEWEIGKPLGSWPPR